MKPTTLLTAAALLALPLGARVAHAQAVSLHARTAGDLAGLCSANPRAATGPAQLNYCDGFAQGAVDVELRHAGATKPFCFPPNTKREITLHEFSNWVHAQPEHASVDATTGLFQFLTERYPCK
jgi:Rap1a immunity proteins